MSDGWAVKVTREGPGPQIEIWYAAISDPIEAEIAIRKHVTAPPETSVVAEQPVLESVLKGMGLDDGQISQWQ
jgi:hypothetical protein